MPFFISPAYCVPRITISPAFRFTSIDVEEDMNEVYLLTGKAPALKIVKSGAPNVASSASVGLISMLCMKRAW